MRRIRLLSLFIIFFSLFSYVYTQDAFSQNHKSFLWEVRSETNTVYILGSVHYMRKNIYPLNKNIEAAFEKSSVLAVEANVNDITGMDMQNLIDKAVYPDNDTLENHVSKNTFELVQKKFEELGMPLFLVDKQKPWFLALSLTSLELLKLGFDPTLGIDVHFLSKAEGKKKIKELESIDYQVNLFSNFSDEEQESFLLYTMEDLDSLEKEADTLIEAWKTGNTQAMESTIKKSFSDVSGMSSIIEKILYERNRNMVSKIEDWLKTDETYFVIIGAGHLVGKRGIIEMLGEKGYHVEQL
jgi:uncharacterized protein YbaP (TraB family)